MNELHMKYRFGSGACSRRWTWVASLELARAVSSPQPSLRVPATPANREYLRRLRAQEATAWELGKDLRQTGPEALDGGR